MTESKQPIEAEAIQRNKFFHRVFEPWFIYRPSGIPLDHTYSPNEKITGDAKIFAEYHCAFNGLAYHLKADRYMNFINFFQNNTDVCKKIAKIMGYKRYTEKGHSYIVITPDKNLQEIMFVWLLLFAIDLKQETIYIKWNNFNFAELSEELERRKHFKPFKRPDDDEVEKLDNIGGWVPLTIYFDVVNFPTGYIYTDEEERQIFGNINNRMLTLMSKNKGMIMQTPQPIPFFEKQIEAGVENLHIFDLRNIMDEASETVNME